MLQTVCAVVRSGKIELTEPAELPEGSTLLVTIVRDDDKEFWLRVSEKSLATVWDNPEDDVYAQLLDK